MSSENKRISNSAEFRHLCDEYRASKRFVEFTTRKDLMLHEDKSMEEEVLDRKKLIFNFECCLSLLDENHNKILKNEINKEPSLWYVGTISRSTFYRTRQAAIEIFLNHYHRLAIL